MSYRYLLTVWHVKIKLGTREAFASWRPYRQPSVSGVLHLCLCTEMLCFKYLLYLEREHALGFSSPLQRKSGCYLSKITSKFLHKKMAEGGLSQFCTEAPLEFGFACL